MPSFSNQPPSLDLAPLYPCLSSTELRFPVAAADGSLSNLEEDTPVGTMASRNEDHDEDNSLAGSTYEFVDTDVESRDGHATASIASTDVGRPDDVASLADTEHSEDESEDEERHDSSIPALRSLENTSSFDTPTIGRSSGGLFDELDRPLPQAIEFQEPSSLGVETISVKHTVKEFNGEEVEITAKGLNLQNLPEHLSLTIRQTMTKHGMSTKEPLRILYVGSHSAKEDIIRKLASAVTSLADNQNPQNAQSQLFNIVQMSAFRSEEVELMHSSGFQLGLEDCYTASSMQFEDNPEKPDVIKLRVNESSVYHSVPDGNSFTVEPYWELPHIAVFYCWNGDSSEAKRTRSLTRKFMSRHGVPSLVISHKPVFDRSLCLSLDRHSVHMCLESQDPEGRGNIIHHRLPIDLTSFLNVDAKQMNRNLAYITGLQESPNKHASSILKKSVNAASKDSGVSTLNPKSSESTNDPSDFKIWKTYVQIGMFVLAIGSLLFGSISNYRPTSAPAISINSKTMSAVSISSTTIPATSSLVPSLTSISASQSVKTSTQTIMATQSPRPNSLSVVPSKEIGTFSKASSEPDKSNKIVCAAEILGDREILIRIPSATKLSWLTREAISVNITRSNVTVDTERAYSSDEGIVLLLAQKEAYGLLSLSIVTTKKPRVNETFQVDFGTTKSQLLQNAVSKIYSYIALDVALVEQTMKQAREVVSEVVGNARSKVGKYEDVTKKAAEQASTAGQTVADIAKSFSFELAKRSAIVTKEITIQAEKHFSEGYKSLQQLRRPMEKGLLKAQVRSKLVWLQMQGKDAEYKEYKKRAAEAAGIKQDASPKCGKHSRKKFSRGGKGGCGARKCGGKKLRT